ncbi:unnamed protein product [Vitrella brassicaformis CCMP3155]|uniref:Methyltransferase type 11 domain-containing protein n=1 Tax=Vitrella brassicaformis (strain CCMP3155) TaxID=1169540 RepID=A0A0G4FXU5_VITBC|nr:unnamed protein product [Vitrella brassicaformis CCMP3155]|eukprot:CEM20249.1 unnamed protein product [Vitrella brassicaformis CCMP3155]
MTISAPTPHLFIPSIGLAQLQQDHLERLFASLPPALQPAALCLILKRNYLFASFTDAPTAAKVRAILSSKGEADDNSASLRSVMESLGISLPIDAEYAELCSWQGQEGALDSVQDPCSYFSGQGDNWSAALGAGVRLLRGWVVQDDCETVRRQVDAQNWNKASRQRELHIGCGFHGRGNHMLDWHKCVKRLGAVLHEGFVDRIVASFGERTPPIAVNQATVIEALPGKGTEYYCLESDAIFDDWIAFVCVHGSLPLSLFNPHAGRVEGLWLNEGDMLTMQGEARYAWTFVVPAVKEPALTGGTVATRSRALMVVMRSIKQNAQGAASDYLFSSEASRPPSEGRPKMPPSDKSCRPVDVSLPATQLEEDHVYQVYDKIAGHFSHTRYKPWPKVQAFLEQLQPGSLVLDTGCGNGKYLRAASNVLCIGSDRSAPLVEICRERLGVDAQVLVADSVRLNFRDGCADAALSIAVIHHLGSEDRRLAALQELVRCVRSGGAVLVYVWAYEQEQGSIGARQFDSQDVFVPWHLQRVYESGSQADQPDSETQPEGSDTPCPPSGELSGAREHLVELKRYYHVFTKDELIGLCGRVCGASVESMYFDANNWAVMLRKAEAAEGHDHDRTGALRT